MLYKNQRIFVIFFWLTSLEKTFVASKRLFIFVVSQIWFNLFRKTRYLEWYCYKKIKQKSAAKESCHWFLLKTELNQSEVGLCGRQAANWLSPLITSSRESSF